MEVVRTVRNLALEVRTQTHRHGNPTQRRILNKISIYAVVSVSLYKIYRQGDLIRVLGDQIGALAAALSWLLDFITVFAGNRWTSGNKRTFNGRTRRWSVPNSNVPSELKGPEQIRKQRQQKATRISQLKSKFSKGKKFGKKRGGKGGR